MVYDIAALHRLYGESTNNETDTVYNFDVVLPFAKTNWDSGRSDTLDFEIFSSDLRIALREGSYSTVPFSIASPNDQAKTLDWLMTNNLGISIGTVLQNLRGGSGQDTWSVITQTIRLREETATT